MAASISLFACPICQQLANIYNIKLGDYQIYKCPKCGLVFAPEAFDVKVDYDNVYETDEYIETQIAPIISVKDAKNFTDILTYRPFFRHVYRSSNNRLLDIGCGVGRFCHAAKAMGWDVTGIDISQNAIEIGKKYATFPMYKSTLEDIIEGNELFDVITAFEVLEHQSNPVDFIEKCKKILKPNGQIFLTVPNWDCSLVQNATRLDWVPPLHLCFYSKRTLHYLINICSLKPMLSGIIWLDSIPEHFGDMLKWIIKRILMRSSLNLGLWILAKKHYKIR